MTENEIHEMLVSILQSHVDDKAFPTDHHTIRLDEFLDSFEMLNLFFDIEQHFNIKFPLEFFHNDEFATMANIERWLLDLVVN